MKPTIEPRLKQQFILTPQLKLSIRLLQLSVPDLQQEVQQALTDNPILELESDDAVYGDSLTDAVIAKEPVTTELEFTQSGSLNPDEAGIDTLWPSAEKEVENRHSSEEVYPEIVDKATASLHEHLLWQMRLTPFSEIEMAIATALIDAIDENGWLTTNLQDIYESLRDLSPPVTVKTIENVLSKIQDFDPPGVAARNLKECLLIQLRQLPKDSVGREAAELVITNYLEQLAAYQYKDICQSCHISHKQLSAAIALIHTLHPHPGLAINTAQTQFIIPDVIVYKSGQRWQTELNPDTLPRLRINHYYAELAMKTPSKSGTNFLRDNLQQAQWFLQGLQNRHETLLKVATCLVKHQQDFLEHGETGMKPLTLQDVAEELNIHVSTVSRVASQKYLHTPRGTFALKYLFSSQLAKNNGETCSGTAIRALIKKLISQESAGNPLSDEQLAKLITEQGIQIARRTVAKYREMLGIPASNERKHHFK